MKDFLVPVQCSGILYQDTLYSVKDMNVVRLFIFSGEPLLLWDDILSNVF